MASPTPRCELKVYQRRFNKNGREETVVVPDLHSRDDDVEADKAYAILVWEVYNEKHQRQKVVVRINSPFLLQAIRDVIGSYTTVASDFLEPFELESPLQMLFHYWNELEEHRASTEDDDVRTHLGLLFDFMKRELGHSREQQLRMLAKKKITFKMLWTLFRPGEILYLSQKGHPWLLVCHKTAYGESRARGPYCRISCQYTDFDGKVRGDSEHYVDIFQEFSFGGENPADITDLEIYPLKFWNGDQADLIAQLEVRGQAFLRIRGVQLKYYDGLAEYLKTPPYSYYDIDLTRSNGYWLPFTETGRVILDRSTFSEDAYLEVKGIKVNPEAKASFCPPFCYGYSPDRKMWCRYFVTSLSDISWKENPWDSLILKSVQKRMLRALVSSHVFPSNARDQPDQKGKGLVILLHGTPGSGKTLTAESAAEASKRILIMSSIGELNKENNAYDFEYNLKELLQHATTWEAVVLLDEADVFLERRQNVTSDATRNALVAVFLKHLEFFSGIVFLTTNRIGAFDPAMKSRIHLALGYQPPEMEIRRQLWMKFLLAIPADEIDMVPEEDVDELLPVKLNGREIAYMVNTARTIARFEKLPLQLDHIRTVISVRDEFEASLRETAKREVSRNKSFGEGSLLSRTNSILDNESELFKS